MAWLVVPLKDCLDVHVEPLDDQVKHQLDDDCLCGPTAELARTEPDAWLVVHHSLDGREQHET